VWLWPHDFLNNFAICRDAAHRAGSSATAELLVCVVRRNIFCWTKRTVNFVINIASRFVQFCILAVFLHKFLVMVTGPSTHSVGGPD